MIPDNIAYLIHFDLRKDAPDYYPLKDDADELIVGRASGNYIQMKAILQIIS
jgi:hypothetical protein